MDNGQSQIPSVSQTPQASQGPQMPQMQAPGSNFNVTPQFGTTGPVRPHGGLGEDASGFVKTIIIIILSLISVTFVGLFIWMTVQYNVASSDVNGQISVAVAKAVDEKAMELEVEFAEREKEPYRDFSGPADYGQLSFKYPKTWSVYIGANAQNGGDFRAYFNPIEVDTVSDKTINALRVTIRNADFETVAAEYQRAMDKKDSGLSVTSVTVGGTIANRYTGKIPGTDFNGVIVIFKIRDKTAILQTDAAVFLDDFNTLLTTVSFNA